MVRLIQDNFIGRSFDSRYYINNQYELPGKTEAFLGKCLKLVLTRLQPPSLLPSQPPSANHPETLQPESSPSTINLEYSSQPPTQPSLPSSPNDPSTFNIELLQPTSTNQPESSQQESQPPPPTPTTPFNLKQLESTLAAQQHLQWKNAVLSFCFSYALAVVSLQYAQTDHQANHPNSSFFLLSFLVLLTFNLILVALFISPSRTKNSEVLEKVSFLVAAAAFCHATAIPFPFELKWAVLALFLLSLLLITIFATYLGVTRKN
ncbi:hypothetical protein CRYUN_Cryun26dG0094100 [Craigia yunnanensis]